MTRIRTNIVAASLPLGHTRDCSRDNGVTLVDMDTTHDDVIKWNHFPRYWPFVRGIHRSVVN